MITEARKWFRFAHAIMLEVHELWTVQVPKVMDEARHHRRPRS